MTSSVFGRLLRRTLYPAILGGSLLAVTLLFDRVGAVWATSVVNVAAGLCIVGAELTFTYRPRWRRAQGDVPTDLCYLALSAVAALVAAAPLMAALAAAALWLQGQVGGTIWPRHWPAAVQLALALLVYELGSYGLHHLSHHSRLWRLHSVHHSVRRLHGLNSIRSHPLDFLFAVATTSGPLLLLGVDERLFAQVTVLGTVNMWLQHANADLKTGWLDWVFVTPNIHRWHHSRAPRRAAAQPGRHPDRLGRRLRDAAGAGRSGAARGRRPRSRRALPRHLPGPARGAVPAGAVASQTAAGTPCIPSIQAVPAPVWSGLVSAERGFLGADYLGALEQAAPARLGFRYAVLDDAGRPPGGGGDADPRGVGARVCAQPAAEPPRRAAAGSAACGGWRSAALGARRLRVLLCGNVFAGGEPGLAWRSPATPAAPSRGRRPPCSRRRATIRGRPACSCSRTSASPYLAAARQRCCRSATARCPPIR